LASLTSDTQAKIAQGVYWLRWLDDDSADPTDKLPNGIADGTLTMTVTESTVMHGFTERDNPIAKLNSITPEALGRSQATGSDSVYYKSLKRGQLGVHREYDLHFSINPGKVPMTVSLEESIYDPNSPILDRLPDSVLAEIAQAKAYAIAHPQPPGEYPPAAPPEKKSTPPP